MSQKAEKMKMAKQKSEYYPCIKYLDREVERKNTLKCSSLRIPNRLPICHIKHNIHTKENDSGKFKGKKFQEGECLSVMESSERRSLELENETLPEEEKLDNYELIKLAYGRAEIINKYPKHYTRDQIFKEEKEKIKQKELRQSQINQMKAFSESLKKNLSNEPKKTIKRQRRTEGPPPTDPSLRSSRGPPHTSKNLIPKKHQNIITFNTMSS